MTKQVILDKDNYIFECPHCNYLVIVCKNELNCCIFRHAVNKNNFKQISPHASKLQCDDLFASNNIYGCSKPFRFVKNNDNYFVEICDYI